MIGGLKKGEEIDNAPVVLGVDGPGASNAVTDVVGSPDWPDDPPEDENVANVVAEQRDMRQRERVPSRSPGISPEPGIFDGEGEEQIHRAAVWKDPLDDEDEEQEQVEPKTKRPRLSE